MNATHHSFKPRVYLIGLAGPAYSGKDTAAAMLAEMTRPYLDVTIRSFADPMRQMLSAIVPHDHMHSPELKEQLVPGIGASYRELAQTLGTDWGRRHFGDIWVRLMDRALFGPGSHVGVGRHHLVLIPDVRFVSESTWIHERGGQVIRIQRPQASIARSHVSEREWQDLSAEAEITNDGTLGELRQKLVGALLRFSIVQQIQAEQAHAA